MKKIQQGDFSFEVTETSSNIDHAQTIKLFKKHSHLSKLLSEKSVRILSIVPVMADEKEKQIKSGEIKAVVYDYKRNHSLVVKGNVNKPATLTVEESSSQPIPSDEEFNEAVQIFLKKEPSFNDAAKNRQLRIYKPMPPVVEERLADGSTDRIINIGLRSTNKSIKHEIIGVNMNKKSVVHFEQLPYGLPAELAGDCGIDYVQQPTTQRGTAGQYNVTVRRISTNEILWKFLVIRPAVSSGTRGSGIELKYVYYKGRKVLHQAHVPILNVRYDGDRCGPYRDWQFEESNFEAIDSDLAPGIRLCNSPAKTIFQSGNDNAGNFRGVAIYVEGDTVVLISEMEAGWYRYISQWSLKANGNIYPRFGFSAVRNSCVCNIHHHHAYWRLDFDVETISNNIAEEFNDPIIFGTGKWHRLRYETRRTKSIFNQRKWRIRNSGTGRGYLIEPGVGDGIADSFGVGDIWFVRYHGSSEFDDGVNITGGSTEQCKAHLDNFLTGESIENKDIVVWYGAHFSHDVHDTGSSVGHIVGPTLKPLNW